MKLETAVDSYLRHVAVERGLSKNTVAAYRRDLVIYAGWLAEHELDDPSTIGRGPEVASDDFPGDGIRWIRQQEGMDAVVVEGIDHDLVRPCRDGIGALRAHGGVA